MARRFRPIASALARARPIRAHALRAFRSRSRRWAQEPRSPSHAFRHACPFRAQLLSTARGPAFGKTARACAGDLLVSVNAAVFDTRGLFGKQGCHVNSVGKCKALFHKKPYNSRDNREKFSCFKQVINPSKLLELFREKFANHKSFKTLRMT